MEYRLLGPLEVRGNDERPLPLTRPMARALLAILLLSANRVVSRERLIDGLWGDEPPETAMKMVQLNVSRLRKLLPGGALQTRPPGYVLEVEPEQLDLLRFERLLADARRAEPERAARVLQEALMLWRGPALAEFDEPFARVERERLDDLRLTALEDRVDADLALGRQAELVGELRVLVSTQRLRERLYGQLMLALYGSGRQVEALEVYREAREALDELGLRPGEQLRSLERAILTQDAALAPPARTRAALPVWPTPFVGRAGEIAAVRERLSDGHRLLTLVGPGGVGKTRLAVEAADGLGARFADGAFFVPLADVRDPAAIRPAIADTLDVRADESLDAFLRSHELLLVLDNFEQLTDDGSVLLAGLLLEAPSTRVLVTSREPLRISGEQLYPVPPLETDEAVTLFVERAREADPSFELTWDNSDAVAEVCQRLDGLPLALELAAARVRLLTPAAMLTRLQTGAGFLAEGPRDAPARQRTIRATIEWSYQLLTPPEQELFARLACFRGGCTIDAAESVCDATLEELDALVDKSLLQRKGDRLTMLETVHEFAVDALERSGNADAVRSRHASYFTTLAERAWNAASAWEGVRSEQENALVLRPEQDNVRVALDWLYGHDGQGFLRLAGAAVSFFSMQNLGIDRARLTAALAEVNTDPTLRARAFHAAAEGARDEGELVAAVALVREALELWRHLGDAEGETLALQEIAHLEMSRGRTGEQRAAVEEAVRVSERVTDVVLVNQVRMALCQLLVVEGDVERAEELATAISETSPERDTTAKRVAMHFLGDCALLTGDFDLALERYLAAVDANWSIGERKTTITELQGVAMSAAGRGDAREALQLEAASDRLFESLGLVVMGPDSWWRRLIARHLSAARTQLGADADQARREGEALTLAAAVALAHSLRRAADTEQRTPTRQSA
jgi:predicted ATPase/DNA-binding SARP family transcriptional activator